MRRQVDQVLPRPPRGHSGAEAVVAAPGRGRPGDGRQRLGPRYPPSPTRKPGNSPTGACPASSRTRFTRCRKESHGIVRGDAVRRGAQPEPRQDPPQQPAAGDAGQFGPGGSGNASASILGLRRLDLAGRTDQAALLGRRRHRRRQGAPASGLHRAHHVPMVARWYHGACFEYQAHAALLALNVLAWAAGNAVGRCSWKHGRSCRRSASCTPRLRPASCASPRSAPRPWRR